MGGTVLVTGGAGYVGAHCCKALASAGYRPVVFDNLVHGQEQAVRWGPLERGDIADRKRLDDVFAQHRPDAVMHFAAYIAVGESVVDPGKYYRNNVAGSLSLIEAAAANGIDKFVFSSTAAAYGLPENVPITEDEPNAPINPYGRSKLMIEQILFDFEQAHGLKSAIMRYFNAAGASPDGEIGECHDPETHLIPLALDAVSGEGPELTVFGDDYPTADGTCIRDYIHVSDLADAHVRALDYLGEDRSTRVFNLGTGFGVSVREILDSIERVTGRAVPHAFGPRRAGDPPVLVSDASRAGRELGWTPGMSDLDHIIETAWSWHQKQARSRSAEDATASR
jgi:UDP-arabinose 4-epimerase